MTVDFESLPIFGYQNAKVQAALSQAEAKLGLLPLEETRVSGTRPARAANVTKDAPLPSTAELLIPAIKPSPDDEQAKRRSLTEKLAATNVRVPFSEMEAARVVSALDKLSAEDRNMWFEMGAAIHSLDWGERGLEIWDDWSQTIPTKYDEIEQRKTWESFAREYSGRKVTIATLFRRAKNAGWIEAAARQDYETDLGNARRLVRRHGGNIRYVHSWRKWLVWSGERWIIDSDGAIVRLAEETIESLHQEAAAIPDEAKRAARRKFALKAQSAQRIEAMIKLAQSESGVGILADVLDANKMLLGLQNGVIELSTQTFRAARREDYVTKIAPVGFDPAAKCPKWASFVETVTGGDQDLSAYLRRAIGYVLTGSVQEEVVFVLWGTGRNGKSTFRETVHALLGDYAIASDAALLTTRKEAGGATPEIARLCGRRLVAINETGQTDILNEARVKFLTSNDKLTGRHLHSEFIDFDPTHKTFLTTNHKPVVRGTDEGIWRRIHLIPFTFQIPEGVVVRDFRERVLMPELPGILNWALAGLAAYLREGLNPPLVVRAATTDYREDMDIVGRWIEERCVSDPAARVATSALYADYARWAANEAIVTCSAARFGRDLSERGFQSRKGTGGRRDVQGLRLKALSLFPRSDEK